MKTLPKSPLRGEIWCADMGAEGGESVAPTPVLIISDNIFNSGPAGLVVIVPLTEKNLRIRTHVQLRPPEGGLQHDAFVQCEKIHSISLQRLRTPIGVVAAETMLDVEFRLAALLGIGS
jgi:mRNA interferase MazF